MELNTEIKHWWIDLTDKQRAQYTYWYCLGDTKKWWQFWKEETPKGWYDSHFLSKEEAELDAFQAKCKYWTWRKTPARSCTLQEAVFDIRTKKNDGVTVYTYIDNKCTWLGCYASNEVLPGTEPYPIL